MVAAATLSEGNTFGSSAHQKSCDSPEFHRRATSDMSSDGEVSDVEADGEVLESFGKSGTFPCIEKGMDSSPTSTQAPTTPVPKEQQTKPTAGMGELENAEQCASPMSAPRTPNVEWGQVSPSSFGENEISPRQCISPLASKSAKSGRSPSASLEDASEAEDLRPTSLRGRGPHRYVRRKRPIASISPSGVSSCSSRCLRARPRLRSRTRSRTPVDRRRSSEDNGQTRKPGDWICSRCNDLQFARRCFCRRCGAAKEDSVSTEDRFKTWPQRDAIMDDAGKPPAHAQASQSPPSLSTEIETLGDVRARVRRLRDCQVADHSWQCEIYVGNLPSGIFADDVMKTFEALFQSLPEFHERYPKSTRPPILCTLKKKKTRQLAGKYLFIEFADAVLASTAVAMTGLKVGGRSVRVCRPSEVPAMEVFPSPLDVQPLRKSLLPHSYVPGATMLDEVWIGAAQRGVVWDTNEVAEDVTKALLGLESVKKFFPGLTKVVDEVKTSQAGKYAFVTLANEVLASTLVAMGEIDFRKGRVRVNWAAGSKEARHKAPNLEILAFPRLLDADIDTDQATKSHNQKLDNSLCLATRVQPQDQSLPSTVYVGNMKGLEAGLLWDAFKRLFQTLSSYREAFPDYQEPVVHVRTGGPGKDSFSFVQLRSPVLASTAVKIAKMEVSGRTVLLARPANFRTPPEGYCPALALDDESSRTSSGETSDEPLEDSEDTSSCGSVDEDALAMIPPPPRALVDVPPPPAPRRPPITLWIGNLPYCGADSRMLEAFLTHQCLEAFATNPSLRDSGLELENGPPVTKVSIHPCKRYAFVCIRDAKLGRQLIRMFNGCEYFGRYLRAAVAWWGDCNSGGCDDHEQDENWEGQTGEEEKELCDLGEAVANLDMKDL